MKSLVDWLRTVRLPVMPEVAAKLVASYQDEQVDITYLRNVIAKDPALTASVLRLANSPLHGLSRSVNSLDAAINLLGISKVCSQAIAICMTTAFELPKGMSRQAYWSHSMHCAGYAMWLALAAGQDESEAWLTGMLLHLGGVLIGPLPQADAAPANATLQRWQAQHLAVGFDEGQVMAAVATQWYFPPSIAHALQHSADPLNPDCLSTQAAVLHLAAMLADLDGLDDASLARLPAAVLSRLGLDVAWLAQHQPDPASFTDTSML